MTEERLATIESHLSDMLVINPTISIQHGLELLAEVKRLRDCAGRFGNFLAPSPAIGDRWICPQGSFLFTASGWILTPSSAGSIPAPGCGAGAATEEHVLPNVVVRPSCVSRE